ncbi:hypothetical protein BJV77DRAFT_1010571 [Russula vinacea]|nr:hypothetical protein BJV77DRAFT_1010571 [Russula vinacea]
MAELSESAARTNAHASGAQPPPVLIRVVVSNCSLEMALGALSGSFLTQVSAGMRGASAAVPLRHLSLTFALLVRWR